MHGELTLQHYLGLRHLAEARLAEVEAITPVVVRGRFRVRGEPWLIAVRRTPES